MAYNITTKKINIAMKNKLAIGLTILLVIGSSYNVKGQTYFKADLTSGNTWVDMIGIWATYGVNKAVNKGFVMDNYLTMNGWSVNVNNPTNRTYIKSSSDNMNSLWNFKLPDILNGLGTGFKLGYKHEVGMFIKNWALYGSLHATYNYFSLDVSTDGNLFEQYGNSLIRCSPGVGGNVTFGKDTSPISVMLDINLRYDFPVFYKGKLGDGISCLKSGLSPRISMIIGGPHLKKKGMNVGVFYEFMSYNLFKESDYFTGSDSSKGYTFGINFTMFPW